ncbi:MAG: quinone-dependent dihydroorotate dehydrogenase [Bacteroidia bacterium]|nr:quinone-dependent dihydroorotate dehydrogenase [Bacteroidia bacterium]
MYSILKPLFFLFDPEKIHHFTFRMLRILFSLGLGGIFRGLYKPKAKGLEKEIFGLRFPNPIGLAAGFDKDGLLNGEWENLGFGFVEMGTVTPLPQEGNPKKRLFRLPKDRALINRMGFNNKGVNHLVERLKKAKRRNIIIGGNIGKNKITPNENATDDYVKCFEALFPYVDYFVVNVSSPNTPGLRELQEKEPLQKLLQTLQELNQAKPAPKPLLLKIAPDLTEGQLEDIVEIVTAVKLDGLVATNTTISREGLQTPKNEVEAIGMGGLSGAPLTARSREVVAWLAQKTEGKLPIIGVGGVMTPADAQALLQAGAWLVQIYSGFVYGGPGTAKRMCRGLRTKNNPN